MRSGNGRKGNGRPARSLPISNRRDDGSPIVVIEKRDPFSYLRRATPEYLIGALRLRLGKDHPPRVEVPVPLTATDRRNPADHHRRAGHVCGDSAVSRQDHGRRRQDCGAEARVAEAAHRDADGRQSGPCFQPVARRRRNGRASGDAEKINVPYNGAEDVTALLDRRREVDGAVRRRRRVRRRSLPNNCSTLAGVLNMFPENQVLLGVGEADGTGRDRRRIAFWRQRSTTAGSCCRFCSATASAQAGTHVPPQRADRGEHALSARCCATASATRWRSRAKRIC